MNFTINLATRVYVDFRKVNIVMVALAAALLFWIFFLLYTVAGNLEQMKKYALNKPKGGVEGAAARISDGDYANFLARIKNVNSIIYKRAYDWLLLFDNLEKLVPEGVYLRGLEPSEKGQVLKISATGRNFASVRKFVENLEFSNTFTDINLTDQVTVKEGLQVKGMNFTVTCKALVK